MSRAAPTLGFVSYTAGYGLRTIICNLAFCLRKSIEFEVLAITGYRLQFLQLNFISVFHFSFLIPDGYNTSY